MRTLFETTDGHRRTPTKPTKSGVGVGRWWSVVPFFALCSQVVFAQTQQYPGKYVISSLVLPGAGETWMKSRLKGEAFLWVEGAIWLTYGAMTSIGNSRNQAAKLVARQYSGSSVSERSEDYYVALERYPTSDLYNEDIRREARELYPDNPDRQKDYIASHSYTGSSAWSWSSDSLRFDYWHRRRGARSVLHTAGFVLGAALVNRVASALDVAFFTRLPDSRVGLAPATDRPGIALQYRF